MKNINKTGYAAFLVLLLVSMLGLSGCDLLSGGDPLDGTAWALTSLDNNPTLEGTTPTAEFMEGQIGGSSGCNSYGGQYEVNGDQLTVIEVHWTLLACMEPEGVMAQEQRFMEMLMNAQSYTVTDDRLEIVSSDGGRLVFESMEAPE